LHHSIFVSTIVSPNQEKSFYETKYDDLLLLLYVT